MENSDFMKNQVSDNRYNVNLSDKFDNTVFNKIYEENREKDVYDVDMINGLKKMNLNQTK